ncbi:hypothetical protein ACSW9O_15370 (plasmid) [Clostridium perfringens]|nr:hypothetical protein [Clostridium perfringens]
MDCNNCKYINIIELEQTDSNINHICNKYKTRCFHNIVQQFRHGKHSPKIYPCLACKNDNYKKFEVR